MMLAGQTIDTITETIKYNYINFNVGLKMKIPLGRFELYSTVGPRIDFMVSNTDSDLALASNIGKSLNNVNYGAAYGFGLTCQVLPKSSLLISATKNYNFNHINNTAYEPGQFGLTIRMKHFFLTLEFLLK